ncbi:hypothetical protein PSECIP111951_01159 [Pseudoalteromonas holothuriae]|uniref:DUF4376 domain-containing protein n=1 Tax=Pseudoalteromonas holothuriae TaxID=2963714 RepID=A0ABN8UIV3_9GAMM|nr:hypothetical protein [Pseudoalteromonas sp. CIP111951]CAH9055037.1 hypothetical protein PSECIP111951_01159 [Pseudoalteromonas sp. CIP111951]
MQQTNEQTAQAVESTVSDEQAIAQTSSNEAEFTQLNEAAISYDDVLTKIALRHGQAQVEQALKTAIEQEQAAHVAAYQQWELEVVDIEAQRQAALAHNANLDDNSDPQLRDQQLPVPELPQQPQIDMSLRRACYRKEHVEVDLAITTEVSPARTEFDDDALVARIYPQTQAHSAEHIATVQRARFKQARSAQLAQQTVTVDEFEFDADELSQQRMARAILVMDEQDTTTWILANNAVVEVTKAQLFSACKLASEQQTALWISE